MVGRIESTNSARAPTSAATAGASPSPSLASVGSRLARPIPLSPPGCARDDASGMITLNQAGALPGWVWGVGVGLTLLPEGWRAATRYLRRLSPHPHAPVNDPPYQAHPLEVSGVPDGNGRDEVAARLASCRGQTPLRRASAEGSDQMSPALAVIASRRMDSLAGQTMAPRWPLRLPRAVPPVLYGQDCPSHATAGRRE